MYNKDNQLEEGLTVTDVIDVNEKKSKRGNKLKSNLSRMTWRVWILVGLLVVSLGVAGYFWQDAQDARANTPEAVAARNQEDSARVLGAVSEVLLTESEDEPTVARIENPEVLIEANPDFYKNAQTGDYLILYPQRAIIFRESESRVINVAPIINTSQLNQGTQAPADDTSEEVQP